MPLAFGLGAVLCSAPQLAFADEVSGDAATEGVVAEAGESEADDLVAAVASDSGTMLEAANEVVGDASDDVLDAADGDVSDSQLGDADNAFVNSAASDLADNGAVNDATSTSAVDATAASNAASNTTGSSSDTTASQTSAPAASSQDASSTGLTAQATEQTVTYTTYENGTQGTATTSDYNLITSGSYKAPTWTTGTYVIDGEVTLTNTMVPYATSGIDGDVLLILLDGSKLTCEGLGVPEGSTLTITSGSTSGTVEGTGEMTSNGAEQMPGIGMFWAKSGTIIINGGIITAKGGSEAPGIGGGYQSDGGPIYINGGTVTATGQDSAAAIGGGGTPAGGYVTSTTGEVYISGGSTKVYLIAGSDATSVINASPGKALLTPGYTTVHVKDADGNDISASGITTPATTTVDLSALLANQAYARIYFTSDDPEATEYTVSFNKSVGDATGTMADVTFSYGKNETLPTNAFVMTGYNFTGWATSSTSEVAVLSDGASVRDLATKGVDAVTLYAVWNRISYAIAYDGNGATSGEMENVDCYYDETATLTTNAYLRDGYTFVGWNTAADGTGTSYAESADVTNLATTDGDVVTLYAMWSKNPDPVEPEKPTEPADDTHHASAKRAHHVASPKAEKTGATSHRTSSAPAREATAQDTLPATGDATPSDTAAVARALMALGSVAALLGAMALRTRARRDDRA